MLTIINKEEGEVMIYSNLNFLDLDTDEVEHFISTTLNFDLNKIVWSVTKNVTITKF